jgi:hypothetical protein
VNIYNIFKPKIDEHLQFYTIKDYIYRLILKKKVDQKLIIQISYDT